MCPEVKKSLQCRPKREHSCEMIKTSKHWENTKFTPSFKSWFKLNGQKVATNFALMDSFTEVKCSATRYSLFSALYLVEHITIDVWNIVQHQSLLRWRKTPCSPTGCSLHIGLWAHWCHKSYSREYSSIQVQNIKNDQNWEFSCHAPAAMKHPTVSIFTLTRSIFRPAFFKPLWAELQILDRQACSPDYFIPSNLGDESRLQNSSPRLRCCCKSHPKKATWFQ